MSTSALYRIASVLLWLFAAGHTVGFRLTDPKLGVGPLVSLMQTIRFNVQGFSRTYWEFYVGFGLFISFFLVFAGLLAWQLSGLSAETLVPLRGTAWSFAVCFVAVAILSWRYFFIGPIIFSVVVSVCLIAAAWRSARPRSLNQAARLPAQS